MPRRFMTKGKKVLIPAAGIALGVTLCFALVYAIWAGCRSRNIPDNLKNPSPKPLGMSGATQGGAMQAAQARNTDSGAVAPGRAQTLTGEAAREQLRENGQNESLGAALQAARDRVKR